MTTNLAALLAKHKAQAAKEPPPSPTAMDVLAQLSGKKAEVIIPDDVIEISEPDGIVHKPINDFSNRQITDKYGNTITLNEEQWQAVELALKGESICLIGPAGTGKTTTMKAVFIALMNAGKLPIIANHGHKYLPENAPGVSISAFTRRATNNIRRNVSEDLQGNCVTIHKLLEYEPQFYEEYDEAKDKMVNKMVFAPARNQLNPLPSNLKTIAFEESSMISVQLHSEVVAATPSQDVQYIYLGDIQQLPPVFGQAILGFKMLELPLVELKTVYRQALDSPIIKLAHRILSGNPIPGKEFKEWHIPGKLTLFPWKKKIAADVALLTIAKFFVGFEDEKTKEWVPGQLQKGLYNPETDAILLPFNKACGTDELNKHIANRIAKSEEKTVWEVIHGFKKSYYSVGDKVLFDREDAIITNIYTNPAYSGARAQHESKSLDYWGNKKRSEGEAERVTDDDDVDFLLAQVSLGGQGEDDERVRACSHVIELQLLDSGREIKINQAGQLNNLILGYAITVHKSQGSEWDKVYLCLHQSHATMLQRELLYTAVTRAKKELFVICEDDSFEKGIKSQRIKGDTLAEKAEYFKGKIENGELQS